MLLLRHTSQSKVALANVRDLSGSRERMPKYTLFLPELECCRLNINVLSITTSALDLLSFLDFPSFLHLSICCRLGVSFVNLVSIAEPVACSSLNLTG